MKKSTYFECRMHFFIKYHTNVYGLMFNNILQFLNDGIIYLRYNFIIFLNKMDADKIVNSDREEDDTDKVEKKT